MAIDRIAWVQSVEWCDGKNNTKYPKYLIKGEDGKESPKAVFEPELQKVLNEALERHLACTIKLDKTDGYDKPSQYWNIKAVQLMPEQLKVNEPIKAESGGVKEEQPPKPNSSSPEVGMCWNNVGNRIGDGSIERDYPESAVKIKSQYYKYIFRVTGIQLE